MTYEELKELVFAHWATAEGKEPDEYEDYQFQEFVMHGDYDVECGKVEFIEQDGGGEGGGEDCYSVIKVDGQFYKFEYSYASYEGYTFDHLEPQLVSPVQRLVTFYE
jgi:hypothetical protein